MNYDTGYYSEADKLKNFEKEVNDYLKFDDKNDPIKQAINNNDINKLKFLYQYETNVYQDHLVYAIYKNRLQLMIFIYSLVNIKYANHNFKSEGFILQCIYHNFYLGFRYLYTQGYKITDLSIYKCFDLCRYDFIEYIMDNINKIKGDNYNPYKLFDLAYNTDIDNNTGYKCLSIIKDYKIPINIKTIINKLDVSGIEYIRNEYDKSFDYTDETPLLDSIQNTSSYEPYIFLYKTDINNKIKWNYSLLKKAVSKRHLNLIKYILLNFKENLDKNEFRFSIFNKIVDIRSNSIVELLVDTFVDDTNKKYFDIDLIYKCILSFNISIAKFLIKRMNVDCNLIVLDNNYIQKMIDRNCDLETIEFIFNNFKVEHNIYNLNLYKCDTEVILYLLSKFKPIESPLLNRNTTLKISFKKITRAIDLDKPGLRQLIYQDLTNMHPKLAKKCHIKLNYITWRNKKIFETLKDDIPLAYDIIKYELCSFL